MSMGGRGAAGLLAPRGEPSRAADTASRVAPTAVRLHPGLQQQRTGFTPFGPSVARCGPQIYVHEGSRQALERRLEAAEGGPVQLAVTDNLRRMVTFVRERGALRVRLHMMFLGAPEAVVDALVRYLVQDDPEGSQELDAFIEQNYFRIRAARPVRGPLHTKGRVHDLLSVQREVAARYFGHATDEVLVSWGRRSVPRGASRKAIKLGTYSAPERLIRVHPALDRAWVPRYFLAYILYHELLHHVVPWAEVKGRFHFHSAEFERRERQYHDYDRALAWEQRNLARLLRAR